MAVTFQTVWSILNLLLLLALAVGVCLLLVWGIRALKKYAKSAPVRQQKKQDQATLGEVLREQRACCHMTQEFVAESLGVSRQAVSKWEKGTSDPSTANLLALAKLYGVSAEELLKKTGARDA